MKTWQDRPNSVEFLHFSSSERPVPCDVLLKTTSTEHGSTEDSENNRKLSAFLHPFNIEFFAGFSFEEWTDKEGRAARARAKGGREKGSRENMCGPHRARACLRR